MKHHVIIVYQTVPPRGKKDALHILSHQICKYSCAEKNTYTFTYLGSLATLYTFYKKNNQKTGILLYFTFTIFFLYCL